MTKVPEAACRSNRNTDIIWQPQSMDIDLPLQSRNLFGVMDNDDETALVTP